MTWFKVCDRLHVHRKARRAGAQAMGLWVMAGSYASGLAGATGSLAPDEIEAVALTMGLKSWKTAAARLVEVGLWEKVGDSYVFHDWADYRPGGESELQRRRAADAERKRRKRRDASAQASTASADMSADIPQKRPAPSEDNSAETSAPLPIPIPKEERNAPSEDIAKRRPPPDPELGDVFTASLATAGYRVALPAFAWKDLSAAAFVHWPELTPAARREALGAAVKLWAAEADAFTRERGFTPKSFVAWLNARGAMSSPAASANDDGRAAQLARNRAFKIARAAAAEAEIAEVARA